MRLETIERWKGSDKAAHQAWNPSCTKYFALKYEIASFIISSECLYKVVVICFSFPKPLELPQYHFLNESYGHITEGYCIWSLDSLWYFDFIFQHQIFEFDQDLDREIIEKCFNFLTNQESRKLDIRRRSYEQNMKTGHNRIGKRSFYRANRRFVIWARPNGHL